MKYLSQNHKEWRTHEVIYLADGLGVGREQGDRVALHSEIPESKNSIICARAQNVGLYRVTRNAGQANLKNTSITVALL